MAKGLSVKNVQKEVLPSVMNGAGVVGGVAASRIIKTMVTDKVDALQKYPEVATLSSALVGMAVRSVNKDLGNGWIGGSTGMLILQVLSRFMTLPEQVSLGSNVTPALGSGNGGGNSNNPPLQLA